MCIYMNVMEKDAIKLETETDYIFVIFQSFQNFVIFNSCCSGVLNKN